LRARAEPHRSNTRLVELRAEGKGEMTPNHRERQILQRLRGNGWVRALVLPASPKMIQMLLAKGWIEGQGSGNELAYRITEIGLAAKKTPIKIVRSLGNRRVTET
jgi:hypothetical protein